MRNCKTSTEILCTLIYGGGGAYRVTNGLYVNISLHEYVPVSPVTNGMTPPFTNNLTDPHTIATFAHSPMSPAPNQHGHLTPA